MEAVRARREFLKFVVLHSLWRFPLVSFLLVDSDSYYDMICSLFFHSVISLLPPLPFANFSFLLLFSFFIFFSSTSTMLFGSVLHFTFLVHFSFFHVRSLHILPLLQTSSFVLSTRSSIQVSIGSFIYSFIHSAIASFIHRSFVRLSIHRWFSHSSAL